MHIQPTTRGSKLPFLCRRQRQDVHNTQRRSARRGVLDPLLQCHPAVSGQWTTDDSVAQAVGYDLSG